METTAEFLKKLTEASGVPGYENEIRTIIRNYMEPLGTVVQDKLGSLICRQAGNGPKVMLAGHMDEVGFMVHHITKDGFLKFVQLGGWWDQVLLGHRVIIKTNNGDVIGVIGAKPPHIIEAEERKKVVEKKDMYIDIGVGSKEEIEEIGVRIGDPVIPDATFAIMANGKSYLSKAFDNRIGCALAIEALRHFANESHPNDLYGVTTVMEEVGLRGARTSAFAIDPDVAIILEVDIAGDVPGIKAEETSVKIGGGPTVLHFDRGMIPNIKLRDLVIDTAAELGLPLQLSSYAFGGTTDGAVIHQHGIGVPTVIIAVPTRHIHSHGAIIDKDDYENAVKLVNALVAKLDADTVAGFTG